TGVLANLVIPPRPVGDQPQSQLDPMPEPAWRGDVAVEHTVVRTRAQAQGEVAPQLADVADHAEHGVSLDRSGVVQLHRHRPGQPPERSYCWVGSVWSSMVRSVPRHSRDKR